MAPPKKLQGKVDLTDDRERVMLDAIRAGNFTRAAALLAGLRPELVYAWLSRGRTTTDEPYYSFALRHDAAIAAAECMHVNVIAQAAARGDWRASAWWLERKVSKHWGASGEKIDPATLQKETAEQPKADIRAIADDIRRQQIERIKVMMGGQRGETPKPS